MRMEEEMNIKYLCELGAVLSNLPTWLIIVLSIIIIFFLGWAILIVLKSLPGN